MKSHEEEEKLASIEEIPPAEDCASSDDDLISEASGDNDLYTVVKVKGDGNCFYRALCVCRGDNEELHRNVRIRTLNFIRDNPRYTSMNSYPEFERTIKTLGLYARDDHIQAVAHAL